MGAADHSPVRCVRLLLRRGITMDFSDALVRVGVHSAAIVAFGIVVVHWRGAREGEGV